MTAQSMKKAAAFLETIDKELICGVCLELFDTPVILPCGHNFCRNCVINHVDSMISFSFLAIGPPSSFNCPLCQLEIQLKQYPVDKFPVNRLLQSIVQLYETHAQVDVFDTAWNTDHRLTNAAAECCIHKQPADRYCESCNTAVCTKCELEKHQTGKAKHKIESLRETAITWQTKIADILAEIKVKNGLLNNRMALLEDMLHGIDTHSEHVLKDLDSSVSILMSSVRRQQAHLKEQFNVVLEDMKRPISKELQTCMMLKTTIQETMKKMSAISRSRDPNLRIKLMKDASKQLESLCMSLAWYYDNQDIPAVTMATWQPTTQSVLDAIDLMTWSNSSGSSLHKASIGVQTDLAQDAPIHPSEVDQNQKVKGQGQSEVDDSCTEINDSLDSEDSSADLLASRNIATISDLKPKDMPRRLSTEDLTVLICKPDFEKDTTVQTDIEARKLDDQSSPPVDIKFKVTDRGDIKSKSRDVGDLPVSQTVTEQGDQMAPQFQKLSLVQSSSLKRHSCPDSLAKVGSEHGIESSKGQSSQLGVNDTWPDLAVMNKGSNNRSPSSNSAALANFVARRRTISPQKKSPGHKAVSPGNVNPVSDEAIVTKTAGQGRAVRVVGEMSHDIQTVDLLQQLDEIQVPADQQVVSVNNPASDRSRSMVLTVDKSGERMPADGGDDSQHNPQVLVPGRDGVTVVNTMMVGTAGTAVGGTTGTVVGGTTGTVVGGTTGTAVMGTTGAIVLGKDSTDVVSTDSTAPRRSFNRSPVSVSLDFNLVLGSSTSDQRRSKITNV